MQTLSDATTRELFNRPGNPGRRHEGATWPIVLNGNLATSMPHKHHQAVRQGQETNMCHVKVTDVAHDMAIVLSNPTPACRFSTVNGGRMAAIKPTIGGFKCIGSFSGHPRREDVDYIAEKDESMEMMSSHDPSVRAMGVLHLLNLGGLVVSESHPHIFETANNLTKLVELCDFSIHGVLANQHRNYAVEDRNNKNNKNNKNAQANIKMRSNPKSLFDKRDNFKCFKWMQTGTCTDTKWLDNFLAVACDMTTAQLNPNGKCKFSATNENQEDWSVMYAMCSIGNKEVGPNRLYTSVVLPTSQRPTLSNIETPPDTETLAAHLEEVINLPLMQELEGSLDTMLRVAIMSMCSPGLATAPKGYKPFDESHRIEWKQLKEQLADLASSPNLRSIMQCM
jgi:hypothetical protein